MFKKLFSDATKKLKHKITPQILIFLGLLLIFIFLRFFQLDERMTFAFDQVNNSWVMKNMIVDHKLPLEGMVAKGNSGFYIGPAYYYLLAPFYFLFGLDPTAAGVFAGVVAIINFIALYIVTRKIFSAQVASIAIFIYTFSAMSIGSDRVPWPVIFVPFVSVLIFYFLYKSITDNPKNIFWLAVVTGFAFHVHFSAVFFPIIILLLSPLILVNKKSWIYALSAIPMFLIWLIPNFLAGSQNGFSAVGNLTKYLSTYYHGFHLVRFMQILKDAFIQFESILFLKFLKPLSVLVLPIFLFFYFREKRNYEHRIISLLFILWFSIPWIVFSVYRGEISDYYFILNRPLVFMALGYLSYRIWSIKYPILKLFVMIFWVYYAFNNIQTFYRDKNVVLPKVRALVRQDILEGRKVEYHEGDPESYLYYVETLKK